MQKNEQLLSETINFLRFPLIVGVVLIHSHFKDVTINGVNIMATGSLPVYTNISYFLSEILSRIAVPLFYLISGFLFFYKPEAFTLTTYRQKLKKRGQSLLIPYLFWNAIVLAFYFLVEMFFQDLLSGKNKMISDYTFTDILWAFWDKNQISHPIPNPEAMHMPINYPLWFIRDLMVVILVSPIIHKLILWTKSYIVWGLGILWFFNWWFHVPGLSITASFFFTAGAYFAIERINFVERFNRTLMPSITLYVLLSLTNLIFRDTAWIPYIHKVGICVGIMAIIAAVSEGIKRGKWHNIPLLSNSSFLIYAYHAMPLAFISKLLFKILKPQSDMMILILYLLCPTAIIIFGILIYWGMQKVLPKLTSAITGGR